MHNARSVVVLLDIWWILENLLRQHLSHPTSIQFSHTYTEGRQNFGDETFRISEVCMANYDYAPDQRL
jgi:hypothetical protein